MQITLNSVRQKTKIYAGKTMSPTGGYTAKLWQGNELSPYLLTVMGHKDNSWCFCIAHGNFLFTSSVAASSLACCRMLSDSPLHTVTLKKN